MKSRSIAFNLTLWYAFSLALILSLGLSFLYRSLRQSFDQESRLVLEDRAQSIEVVVKREADPVAALKYRVEHVWPQMHFEKIFVRALDSSGNTISESPNLPSSFPENRYLTLNTLIKVPDKGEWKVFLAIDLAEEKAILSEYRNRMLFFLVVAFMISISLGRFIASRGLGPVRAMARTLKEIDTEDLTRRIDTAVPDELEVLRTTFNELLERIQVSVNKISRFSSDIAHEIRTPLNNLRGELELAMARPHTVEEYQQIAGSGLEECQRLGSIVDSLLFLARAEAPQSRFPREELEFYALVQDLIEFYEPSSIEAEVAIRKSIPAGLRVFADRALLQAAVGNILSNSIRYTKPGGSVLIRAQELPSEILIEVSDNGSGIAPEHLPFVFDRLYRADPQRGSGHHFGLGLSIVQAVMKMHGGDASIQSQAGRGTTVRLRFPTGPRTDKKS